MVRSLGLAAALLCASMQIAHADEAEELRTKGEELGKQGEWSLAIAAFKRAEVLQPRALNACLLGLAYTRRELWAQAELFFAQCHARAKPGDEAPEWVAEAEQTLVAKIAAAEIPPITIDVVAPGAKPKLTMSGFEPDEAIVPGVHHLAAGRYTLEVIAPGYNKQSREITVVKGQPQRVTFDLQPTLVPNEARDTHLPLYVLGAGVALVAAGTITDFAKVQPLRDDLAKSKFAFDAHASDFKTWRAVTIGLWGAGAVAVGLGVWLEVRRREMPAMITANVERGGAMFGVAWQR